MYLKQAIEKPTEPAPIHLLELEMIQEWSLLKK